MIFFYIAVLYDHMGEYTTFDLNFHYITSAWCESQYLCMHYIFHEGFRIRLPYDVKNYADREGCHPRSLKVDYVIEANRKRQNCLNEH